MEQRVPKKEYRGIKEKLEATELVRMGLLLGFQKPYLFFHPNHHSIIRWNDHLNFREQ